VATELRNLLIDSIKLRLRSDVPVGVSLSGGLDSSSVVGGLRILLDENLRNLHSFAVGYDYQGYDERFYIFKMLNWSNLQPHFISPPGKDLITIAEKIVYHQDEPYAGTSIYASWKLMEKTRQTGVPVILVGQGGDEFLAGYNKYLGPYVATLLQKMDFSFLDEILKLSWVRKQGILKLLKSGLYYLLSSYLPTNVKTYLNQYRKRKDPFYLNKSWADRFPPFPVYKKKFHDILNNILYLSVVSSPLPSLLHIDDRNSMAFGVETRAPFLDYRIAEFLFKIGGEKKIKKGYTKYPLRRAFKDILPHDIIMRKDKLGYPTPLSYWLRDDLRAWAEKILTSKSFKKRPYFNFEGVKTIWKQHLSGTDNSFVLWSFINLELWFRKFID
jgi:asparagine synthase (glutamine-hydrolysing)